MTATPGSGISLTGRVAHHRGSLAWWAALTACLTLLVTSLVATAVLAAVQHDWATGYGSLAMVGFVVVALIILRTQPKSVVAWCFLVGITLLSVNSAGDAGLAVGLSRHWDPALLHVFAWMTGAAWFPGLFLMLTVGLLHFPDGPVSPRWRWVTWVAGAVLVVYPLCFSLGVWSVPLAVLRSDSVPHAPGLAGVFILIAVACIPAELPVVIGVGASLVVRWRRSSGVQRLQIRWVAAAGALALVMEISLDLLGSFLDLGDALQTVVETSTLSLIAVATGVAITRHGLYEIDRIVSRTVSYLLISAVLVGVYLVVVTGAALVIPDRYGSAGVAVATLAAVALFVPLRSRVQHAVDRRFDRSRYDADVMVGSFATALREDLSLAGVHEELLRAVRRSVAPATATIWLAPPLTSSAAPE